MATGSCHMRRIQWVMRILRENTRIMAITVNMVSDGIVASCEFHDAVVVFIFAYIGPQS